MFKNSFTVVIPKAARKGTDKDLYILGVTSICPNLNGVLIECEKRHGGVQIEHFDLDVLNTGGRTLTQMQIWYTTDDEINGIFLALENHPDWTEVHDGRA